MSQKFLQSILNMKERFFPYLIEEDDTYPPEIEERRQIYKKDLRRFVIDFFPYAGSGGNKCDPGIVVDGLTEALQAMEDDHFRLLLFSCPSREAKSTILGVLYPAWKWIRDPTTTFLTTCYSHTYAVRDNLYMQRLINSPIFQMFFGKDFKLTVQNKIRSFNNLGGQRISTSILGQNTGEGGSVIIGDDISSMTDRFSEKKLERSNSIATEVLFTRMNRAYETKLIFAQHRNSPFDVIAKFLEKEIPGMVYLPLRMEYRTSKPSILISPKTGEELWRDPRRMENQLLSPNRVPLEAINLIKAAVGKQTYESVYQCNPMTSESQVFRSEWFKLWNEPAYPKFYDIIMSFDTAISSDVNACSSAMTVWGVFKDNNGKTAIMLLNLWSGKKEWTDLRQMVIRLSKNYNDVIYSNPRPGHAPPSKILMEDHSSGSSMIQSLRKIGIDIIKFRPNKTADKFDSEDGKTIRGRLVSPFVESGRVWVMSDPRDPESPRPSAQHFIHACTNFPSKLADTRDLVDTFTQVINFLSKNGDITTVEEDIREIHGRYHNKLMIV